MVSELTVIVPVHNGQSTLQTALTSMRQNHADGIEYIVIDDHSTDDTPRIIEAALPAMPYVTFIRNPENFGVAKSRNIAFEQIQSRYISYFDADDWYLPGHLSRLLAAIKAYGTDMVRIDHVRSELGRHAVLDDRRQRDIRQMALRTPRLAIEPRERAMGRGMVDRNQRGRELDDELAQVTVRGALHDRDDRRWGRRAECDQRAEEVPQGRLDVEFVRGGIASHGDVPALIQDHALGAHPRALGGELLRGEQDHVAGDLGGERHPTLPSCLEDPTERDVHGLIAGGARSTPSPGKTERSPRSISEGGQLLHRPAPERIR